jgi:hypothetical protein
MKGEKILKSHCIFTLVVVALLISLFPSYNAFADEYNPQEAGHPLRIIAYLLNPFGVLIDYGLMRPAHCMVHKEPFRTIFGHELDE